MNLTSLAMPLPRATGAAARAAFALLATVSLILAIAVPADAATDPRLRDQWGLTKIGASTAWSTGQGAGVVIAIVDSGVDLAHDDLKGNLVAGYDFVDNDTTPQDEYFHGTHVAGIAAAVLGNGRGGAGVAPKAKIMPIRVLDEDGSGRVSDVEAGVRWAVDHGADVVNLSLGRQGQQLLGSGLGGAIDYAWSKGVVVVVAAGNEFIFSSGFSDEPAIVVSATTINDQEPDYSSGVGSAKWGMSAPGGGCALLTCSGSDDVLSTYWQAGTPNAYAYLQGTSMAAPHVAGAAAVLLGLGLSPQQTVDRLLSTAKDIGPSGRDSTYGAGRLDLAKAVSGLSGSTTPKPEPKPEPKPDPKPEPQPAPKPAATQQPTTTAPKPSTGGGSTGSQPKPAATTAPAASGGSGAIISGTPTVETGASEAPSTAPTEADSTAFDGATAGGDADAAGDLTDASGTQVDVDPASTDDERGWLPWLALLLLAAAGTGVWRASRTQR